MQQDKIKYTEFIAGLSKEPPIECDFKIGDEVTFTNEVGVSFQEMIIIGFADKPNPNGAFIYIAYPDERAFACAYWFPHSPKELSKTVAIKLLVAKPFTLWVNSHKRRDSNEEYLMRPRYWFMPNKDPVMVCKFFKGIWFDSLKVYTLVSGCRYHSEKSYPTHLPPPWFYPEI